MSKVAIQGNASGTGTFTIAAPNSNTDRTLTLPDEAGTVLSSGTPLSSFPSGFANGITMADTWRLTSNISGSQTPITAWERHTTSLAGLYGSSGMSVASGIFTFPSTGLYLVSFGGTLDENGGGADNAVAIEIKSSDNFSSNDDLVTYQQTQLNSSNSRAGLNAQVVLTVTDTSNDKVKFHLSSQLSSNILFGSTDGDTLATFIRLGDLA